MEFEHSYVLLSYWEKINRRRKGKKLGSVQSKQNHIANLQKLYAYQGSKDDNDKSDQSNNKQQKLGVSAGDELDKWVYANQEMSREYGGNPEEYAKQMGKACIDAIQNPSGGVFVSCGVMKDYFTGNGPNALKGGALGLASACVGGMADKMWHDIKDTKNTNHNYSVWEAAGMDMNKDVAGKDSGNDKCDIF